MMNVFSTRKPQEGTKLVTHGGQCGNGKKTNLCHIRNTYELLMDATSKE